MRKPNQSLEVKQSNDRTGTAHRTGTDSIELISQSIRRAVRLEKDIDTLSGVGLVREIYSKEMFNASESITRVIDTLSEVMGCAFVEQIREERI